MIVSLFHELTSSNYCGIRPLSVCVVICFDATTACLPAIYPYSISVSIYTLLYCLNHSCLPRLLPTLQALHPWTTTGK